MKWGPDRWRLYALALAEAGRALKAGLAGLVMAPNILRPSPRRLLIAPQDLRTADPTVASDIYGGHFAFAGRLVATGGRSPFEVDPPSRAWAETLYGFGWLRHLRAADTALARANARTLVNEFVSRRGNHRAIVRATPVTARRLLSFLAQSPLLLEGAEHGFYQRLLRSIDRMARDLSRDVRHATQPLHRLTAAVALCYAGLCCEGFERVFWRARRQLARELDRQILPDGGHRSRNPQVAVELLLDLLALRQAFASRSLDPPEEMANAIDRMLPLLRLLRQGDGSLGRFHGMGRTAADQLATLLMYEGARGHAMRRAPRSGYERLEAGKTVVVAEVGPAPSVEYAADAHAGCLSFEMSSGAQAVVVNCGAACGANDETRRASRSTAAHSTATIAETSSGRFLARQGWFAERWIAGWLIRRLGQALIRGPREVPVDRREAAEAGSDILLRASHDGYRRFGIMHERIWRLSGTGARLEGEDGFARPGSRTGAVPIAIRFHLAPGVRASRVQGGDAVVILLPNREAWQFEAEGVEPALEESIFFAASEGLRRAEQIVLSLDAGKAPRVKWRFERLAREGTRHAPRGGDPEPPPLL
ncbi:MAG TPA: heparinase II/III family protein [Beijerinckiaceae bacterium]|nr:heparinase II/III family protein [Beijerinckiaceae bacterium]